MLKIVLTAFIALSLLLVQPVFSARLVGDKPTAAETKTSSSNLPLPADQPEQRAGVIRSVDIKVGSFVVADQTFTFDPATVTVFRSGRKVGLTELKPNLRIRFSLTPQDKSGKTVSVIFIE